MRGWTIPSPLPGRIEASRTLIRRYRKGDGPRLHAAIAASRDLAWLWLPLDSSGDADVDDTTFYVEQARRSVAKRDCRDFPLAVLDRDEATLLGGVSFHHVDVGESTAEVGYWIRGDRQGEGLCTETVGALVTAGFTAQEEGGWGFRRITVLCAAANVGSVRVAQKLGLRLERRERAERYGDRAPSPGYLDSLGFGVLASEWDFAAHRAKPGIAWPSPI